MSKLENAVRQPNVLVLIALTAACVAAVAPWPYGYYQLLRWAMMIGCGYLALQAHRSGDGAYLVWLLGGLAVVYNPIVPLSLGRDLWMVVNLTSAAALAFVGWRAWHGIDAGK